MSRLSMRYTTTRTGAAIARRWLALPVVLLFAFIVVDKPLAAQTEQSDTVQEPTVFRIVDEMPEYPGGMKALYKFISDNSKYPKSCLKAKIEGTVLVQFVINKEGKVEDLKVLRGAHEDMDKEALRVLGLMKDWTPGKEKGKAVDVYYTLPLRFSLE